MANKFSDDEALAIHARAYELLSDEPREQPPPPPEPETREEIVRREMARPRETHNQRVAREIAEQEAAWATERAKREAAEALAFASAEALAARAARFDDGRIAGLIGDALCEFDEEITGPLARELDRLREKVVALETEITKLRSLDAFGPVDLPNPLAARRNVQ